MTHDLMLYVLMSVVLLLNVRMLAPSVQQPMVPLHTTLPWIDE